MTKGFSSIAAFKHAAVWGTAVACGASTQVEFFSDGITDEIQRLVNEQLTGSHQRRPADVGNKFFRGELPAPLKYESLTPILAHALGIAGVPTTVEAAISFRHALKPKKHLDGIFGTLVFDYTDEIHEYASHKLTGFRIEVNADDQIARITFRGAASDQARNTSSGTNNTTTILTVTLYGVRDRVLWRQGAIRANAQGGAGLGAGDLLKHCKSFMLDFERTAKVDDVTLTRGFLIDEPTGDGHVIMTGELGFSQYSLNNRDRYTEALAQSRQKMDAIFTGAALGANNYKFSAYMNEVQFSGRPNIGGAGSVAWTLPFECHEAAAVPTGFPTGYTDGITIELVNSLATDPLV